MIGPCFFFIFNNIDNIGNSSEVGYAFNFEFSGCQWAGIFLPGTIRPISNLVRTGPLARYKLSFQITSSFVELNQIYIHVQVRINGVEV